MANKNDFKLLQQKCLRYFDMAKPYITSTKDLDSLSEIQKARYGFYYFAIQLITSSNNFDEITESITDQEFNSTLFDIKERDYGIDAVYFDVEEHHIFLFNFKYREKYNEDKEQSKNDALSSIVFLNCLKQEETQGLTGKSKTVADKIIEYNDSAEIWETKFYYVSNESKTLSPDDVCFNSFKPIKVETIALNEIVELASVRPKHFDATMVLPNDAIMSFTESSLASSKSYIVRMPLTDLLRITCNEKAMRDNYNLEEEGELYKYDIDLQVLFDNVRGFIVRSKFNQNIEQTLEESPSKFFFYNNGITIVADNIELNEINSGKKVKLEIKNFQVLNGGQTLRTIHKYNKQDSSHIKNNLSKAEVLVKFFNVTDDQLKGRIGEYTNSQNMIDQRDLKSLRTEQQQLEQYLRDFNILYLRKKGDTGNVTTSYKYTIGMDLLGQMLLAYSDRPEMTSNKKREIFGSFYDELFGNNEDLLSNGTVELIHRYFYIRKIYNSLGKKATNQKLMYLLYLDKNFKEKGVENLCLILDEFIDVYKKAHNIDKSSSRVLIDSKFKKELDSYMEKADSPLINKE